MTGVIPLRLRLVDSSGINKNLIADFGAPADGSSADDTAFLAFRSWAIANQGSSRITLTLDSGRNFRITDFPCQRPFSGVKNLVVIGYGATLTMPVGSSGFCVGGYGIIQDDQHHALMQTVSAGSYSVTLLTVAQTSRFSVGQWVMAAGIDLQGFGYPPNPGFFEYLQIATIDAVGGVITFNGPLANSYKSTWPSYFAGNGGAAPNGGPAMLYSLSPTWDTQVEIRGLTINSIGQTGCDGRDITLRDVVIADAAGAIPSQNLRWRAINCDYSLAQVEVDKMVVSAEWSGSTIRRIDIQSSSIQNVKLTNGTTVTDYVNGTALTNNFNNSTINELRIGATGYGGTQSISADSSVISKITLQGVVDTGTVGTNAGVNNAYGMSSGLISVPQLQTISGIQSNGGAIQLTMASTAGFTTGKKSQVFGVHGTTEANGTWALQVDDATHVTLVGSTFVNAWTSGGQMGQGVLRWAYPGAEMYWIGGGLQNMRRFTVTDVTADAVKTSVQTSEPGGFPSIPGGIGSTLYVGVHPAPKMFFTNCTGCQTAVAYSRPAANGVAFGEYWYATYDGSSFNTVAVNQEYAWGALTSLSINVTQAYTGVQATQTLLPAELTFKPSDASRPFYAPTINVKTAGNRVVTTSGVTGNQTGDANLALAEAAQWFGQTLTMQYNHTISGEASNLWPIVTVEMQLDQGIP